jgi:hypothetical protein
MRVSHWLRILATCLKAPRAGRRYPPLPRGPQRRFYLRLEALEVRVVPSLTTIVIPPPPPPEGYPHGGAIGGRLDGAGDVFGVARYYDSTPVMQGGPHFTDIAFRWTAADGTQTLAALTGGIPFSSVIDVAPDGRALASGNGSLYLLSPSGVVPESLKWNTQDGGVDFSYQVSGEPVAKETKIALYWSSTDKFADAIGGAIPNTTQTIVAGNAVGEHGPFHMSADLLSMPPDGATHLLAVTDPDNTLGDFDPTQNVQSLALPDLVATSLNWHVNPGTSGVGNSGGVELTYEIGNTALSEPAPVALYWAHGTNFDPAKDTLAYPPFDSETTLGPHTKQIRFIRETRALALEKGFCPAL